MATEQVALIQPIRYCRFMSPKHFQTIRCSFRSSTTTNWCQVRSINIGLLHLAAEDDLYYQAVPLRDDHCLQGRPRAHTAPVGLAPATASPRNNLLPAQKKTYPFVLVPFPVIYVPPIRFRGDATFQDNRYYSMENEESGYIRSVKGCSLRFSCQLFRRNIT